MNKLVTEYDNWADESLVMNIWGECVCKPKWRFGQKSNNDTVYPMWFQTFYDTFAQKYIVDIEEVKIVASVFMETIGKDDYILVRNMLCGNTFGQDGDIHDDWQVPGESLTGVLYLNPRWEDNWGGETIIYDKENLDYCEISKFKSGKLIVFDGSNPHIGKGPQRACGEVRSIISVQAIKKDAWQKHLDKMKKKS